MFPMDTTVDDYSEAVELVVNKLAYLEKHGRSIHPNFRSERGYDLLPHSRGADGGRFLAASIRSRDAARAQQAILSSACTVIKPQTQHPRLNRSEAQQLLNKSKFRHTQAWKFHPQRLVPCTCTRCANSILARRGTLTICAQDNADSFERCA